MHSQSLPLLGNGVRARVPRHAALLPPVVGGGPAWKIAHDNQGKWVNPLIGWTSTADPLENVARQLYFSSKEEAVAFAGGMLLPPGLGAAPRQRGACG